MNLTDLLQPFNTIAIIGLGKNVGKTTVLNHILQGFAGYRLALTSIGRDGEDVDVVTKTAKPRIYVPMGTIIITAEALLAQCDITTEILTVTDISTPLGRIVAIMARSAGFVQIGGPSITSQLSTIIKDIQIFKPGKIIIDGAISRKSLAGPSLAQAVVLCTGAAVATNIDELIAQTRHHVDILTLPQVPQNTKLEPLYMPGAVSDQKMRNLLLSADGKNLKGRHIVADDACKIFISPDTFQKLQIRQATLAVKTSINPVAVAVNPTAPGGFSFDSIKLLDKMREALPLPVFDVGGEIDV